ncbi:hypothetical protein [Pseudoalteromonas phenolica]|uniref:hypothetical protein n=1 Tax=Pseudoalteromonas phenolica TaxID=161398 RepID=UPI00384F3681
MKLINEYKGKNIESLLSKLKKVEEYGLRLLFMLALLIALNTNACGNKDSNNVVEAFITLEQNGAMSYVSVYVPVKYGNAEVMNARFSLRNSFEDEPIFNILTPAHKITDEEKFTDYVAFRFDIVTSNFNQAHLTVHYRDNSFDSTSTGIAMCTGPVRLYRVDKLPIKVFD